MSIMFCHRHDRYYDSDYVSECTVCESDPDPIIRTALDLKKELETDTPPEFQAKVAPIMDQILKTLLGAKKQ